MPIGTKSVGFCVLAEVQIFVLVPDDGMSQFLRLTGQLVKWRRLHIEMLHGHERDRHANHATNDWPPDAGGTDDLLRRNASGGGDHGLNSSILDLNPGNRGIGMKGCASLLSKRCQGLAKETGFHVAITGNIKGAVEIIGTHDGNEPLD